MSKRGRVSAAEAEQPPSIIRGIFGKQVEPDADMSPEQKTIWRATIADEPAELFNTAATRALLRDYCRHRDVVTTLSALIDAFDQATLSDKDKSRHYADLLRMRELESRAAANIATKLRLTNQSRYRADTAATAAKKSGGGVKPWET